MPTPRGIENRAQVVTARPPYEQPPTLPSQFGMRFARFNTEGGRGSSSEKNKPLIPVSDEVFNAVIDEVTGGKPPEQIQAELEQGKWPFAISAEQMRRADIARTDAIRRGQRGLNPPSTEEKK